MTPKFPPCRKNSSSVHWHFKDGVREWCFQPCRDRLLSRWPSSGHVLCLSPYLSSPFLLVSSVVLGSQQGLWQWHGSVKCGLPQKPTSFYRETKRSVTEGPSTKATTFQLRPEAATLPLPLSLCAPWLDNRIQPTSPSFSEPLSTHCVPIKGLILWASPQS